MASLAAIHNLCRVPSFSPECCSRRNQTLALASSPSLSSTTFSRLRKQTLLPSIKFNKRACPKRCSSLVVYAAESNFLKALQTAWKIGKDGVEAGTNMVPNSVPRPVARISVTILTLSIALFVLKSFLSTAFFVLATMGLVYFIFIALNKDEGPRGGGGNKSANDPVDDPVEEARRIMDKYK